jgi:diguanylate cyclase (GGDEF)-like protein/PAS domain S-box-containing protein
MLTFYVLLLFLAGLTLAALAVHTYRVPVGAARPFSAMLMFGALFAVLQGAAYLVGTAPARIPIAEWIVVPSAFMPVLYVLVALTYTGRSDCLTRTRRALFLLVPTLFSGLTLTSTHHTLFRYNYQVVQQGVLSTISTAKGPLFWLFYVYVLAGTAAACVLLLRSLKDPQLKPRNTLLILGGMLVPVISEVTQNVGLTLVAGYNLTPLTFILSGGLFLTAVLRGGLFRAQTIGRSVVMDHMTDLVLVFDRDGKVVDCNEAVRAAAGAFPTDFRTAPADLPQAWAGRLRGLLLTYHSEEIILEVAGGRRCYECTSSPVKDPRGNPVGSLLILHDVTARNQAEQVLREQTALAQALRDAGAALTSTLDLNDVFARILENAHRVIEYDSVGILELDQARKNVRLVRRLDANPAYSMMFVKDQWLPIDHMFNLAEVASSGMSVIVPDTRQYPGWVTNAGEEWVRSNLVVPIVSKGKLIGFLGVNSARVNDFTESSAERLQAFADQAAIAIENARLYENLQELAITDVLTGVFNRQGLLQFGERELERALRFDRPLSALMVDLDHFKQINDTFGHPGGDQVLRAVADLCRSNLRKVDILARYGGDEFIMLLPEAGMEEALQAAERLRSALDEYKIRVTLADGTVQAAHVTASIGVASLNAKIATMEALLTQVDQALYDSKHAGRNRVKMVRPDDS